MFHRRATSLAIGLAFLLSPFTRTTAALAVTPPTIGIGDTAVYEGNSGYTTARVVLTLSDPQATDLFVNYTTVVGTASGGVTNSGADFVNRSGRAKFKAGKTSAFIAVRVVGDTGFETDESFTVTLSAVTSASVSFLDDSATITIRNTDPSPVPGLPTGLAAVPGPLNRYLTATWSSPIGGSVVNGYDLEVVRGATTNVVSNVTSPAVFGCGLASLTDTCTIRIRAYNDAGPSPWSAAITASTWAPPAAPPNLTAQGTTVFWDAPTSDQPLTNYWVFKSLDNGSNWTMVTTTANLHASATCSICLVRVQAQSSVGFGAFSTISIAFSPPSAPTALVVTRDVVNPALLHIVWSPPLNAMPAVETYDVMINDFSFPFTITGLIATAYDYRTRNPVAVSISVVAHNAAGMSLPATVIVAAG